VPNAILHKKNILLLTMSAAMYQTTSSQKQAKDLKERNNEMGQFT
jgi:hypothetical protein